MVNKKKSSVKKGKSEEKIRKEEKIEKNIERKNRVEKKKPAREIKKNKPSSRKVNKKPTKISKKINKKIKSSPKKNDKKIKSSKVFSKKVDKKIKEPKTPIKDIKKDENLKTPLERDNKGIGDINTPFEKTGKKIKEPKTLIEKPDKETKEKESSGSIFKNMGAVRKIPDKIVRIPTGISQFDKIIQGGFEKNSINLLVGETGSGKSIIGMQFLMDGIKKGEKCLYITFEETKKSFYLNMKELGWDLEEYEKKGDFYFLDYTPRKVNTMLEEGGGIIENIVLNRKISRIVIDSITSFILLFDNEIEKREAVLSLFNLLKKWDCTTIVSHEGDPLKDESGLRILEFATDSIILLYFLRKGPDRDRFLEVLKMKGTDHSKKVYPVSIGKKGVSLSSRPYDGELE